MCVVCVCVCVCACILVRACVCACASLPVTAGLRVITQNRLLCCCDIFPNIDRVRHARCPALVIHGQADAEVGVGHGMRLAEALASRKGGWRVDTWYPPDAGHNDVRGLYRDAYFETLVRFIAAVDPAAAVSAAAPSQK